VSILLDHPASVHTLPTIECDEHACTEATSRPELCRCRCEGAGHGRDLRARVAANRAAEEARNARAGGFIARMVAMGAMTDGSDEDIF
jgi:hypothetical protein